MSITSALVLFVVIWFMTFLIVIPFRLKTQGDMGRKIRGTMDSSPEEHHLKQKALITTGLAIVIWCIIAGIIVSGWITVRDIDWFNRMGPPSMRN
ncbi:DUF1467 family protein [Mesobacterium pallidum]|uniref:DUF1467 family protein n=1 Tax=Mesobacterium pallidum TaxID=2872037 RepID=UPI001EE1DC6E|nr:DUF1467 family protein [Mesobacterium pallidum]